MKILGLDLGYDETSSRNGERFIWVFALTLLGNILAFDFLKAWGIPVFLLSLIFLLAAAGWLGVHRVR